MRYLLILFLLVGCSDPSKMEPKATRILGLNKVCLDGVVYYSGGRKLAPAYNREGEIQLCDLKP